MAKVFAKDQYYTLENDYFIILHDLVEFMYHNSLVPTKLLLFKDIIKNYIQSNKIEIIKSSLENILPMKEEILDFNFDNLEHLEDLDNLTCKINSKKNNKNNNYENNQNDFELFHIIIEVKDRAVKLSTNNKKILKKLLEIMILLLEEIYNIF